MTGSKIDLKQNAIIGLYGCCLIFWAAYLTYLSDVFSYDYRVATMPIRHMTGVLLLGGAGFFAFAIWLLKYNQTTLKVPHQGKLFTKQIITLLLMITAGVICRIIFCFSEPLLEDDYQRYMVDGVLFLNSINPYQYAPEALISGAAPSHITALAKQTEPVLSRVNHPHLRTIYPIGAESFFALGALLAPAKLIGLRAIYFMVDLINLWLIISLLKHLKKPPLLAALYWLNPLVLKEVYNSVHMDILLVPFLLAGLWLYLNKKYLWAAVAILGAVTIKLWPVFLLPITLFPLLFSTDKNSKLKCLIGTGLCCGTFVLLAWPVLSAGLDQTSGFLAYAQKWQTNSGLFRLLSPIFSMVHPMALRFTCALLLASLSLYLGWRFRSGQPKDHHRFYGFAGMCFAMFLLSPAQFPWYLLWILAFLPMIPFKSVILLTGLINLYYLRFHLFAHGGISDVEPILIGIIWFPFYLLLFKDIIDIRKQLRLKSSHLRHV